MHLKMSSAKWRPFCPGGDELTEFRAWISYCIHDILSDVITPLWHHFNGGLFKPPLNLEHRGIIHYDDVIMETIASQITSLTSVYSTVYSGADQSKHQSSASLAFVWGIHRGPVNSPHKWPVTRQMFPFDDVIMTSLVRVCLNHHYNDVTMGSMASQITSLTIVYSAVYSGTDQRKHRSSASLAFELTGDR